MRRWIGVGLVSLVLLAGGVAFGYVLFHDDGLHNPAPANSSAGEFSGRVDCKIDGLDAVTVPDLIGRPLPDAVSRARASGLQVVQSGTVKGDPAGASATVVAQKPEGGTRVPAGACVGFRTKT